MKADKLIFKAVSILWSVWGLFHLLGGIGLMFTLNNGLQSIPNSVTMKMMGDEMPFHITQTLMEHGFNNAWFGLVVTIGSGLIWKGHKSAVILCAIVGGLAHLGYTIFIVFPGYTPPTGMVMTAVVTVAVAPSFIAYPALKPAAGHIADS